MGVFCPIESGDQQEGILVLFLNDSFEFLPPEEEVFRRVLDLCVLLGF